MRFHEKDGLPFTIISEKVGVSSKTCSKIYREAQAVEAPHPPSEHAHDPGEDVPEVAGPAGLVASARGAQEGIKGALVLAASEVRACLDEQTTREIALVALEGAAFVPQEDVNDMLATAQRDHEDVQVKLVASEHENARLRERVSTLNMRESRLRDQLKDLKEQVRERDETIDTQQDVGLQAIADAQAARAELAEQGEIAVENREKAEASIRELEEQLNLKEARLAEKEGELERQRVSLADARRVIVDAGRDMARMEKKIEDQKGKMSELRNSVRVLRTELKEARADAEKSNDELARAGAEDEEEQVSISSPIIK